MNPGNQVAWILALFLGLTIAMAITEFIPTEEWQFVPEGVAIPGGLEIRMDIEKGGRWARILPGTEEQEQEVSNAPVSYASKPIEDFDALEEKAYDHDDGADIAQEYGNFLVQTFSDPSNPKSDQAGQILAICLRNNRNAARSVTSVCPDLPLALTLNKRSLSILNALVSTKEGLLLAKSHNTLDRIRQLVAGSAAVQEADVPRYISNLLKNLVIVGEDGEEFCRWVDALQQAYYLHNIPELKELALNIVKHNEEFEALTVECKPAPGLLPEHEERKRAVESAQRFANPKAARNHFDEL